MDALKCVTALQDEAYPSIIDQLNYQSSPGCWLPWPYSKIHVTALQAKGYPSIMDQLNYPQLFRLPALLAILKKPYVAALQAAASPGHTRKTMSQLSRLLALLAILKKPCHRSRGCWLFWPYSKNHVIVQLFGLLALKAIPEKIMSQLSRLLALQAILKKPCHSSPGCRLSKPCLNI